MRKEVRFARSTDTWTELKERVASLPRARSDYVLLYGKAALFLIWAVFAYYALVFHSDTFIQAASYALLLLPALIGIGFNIQHDGNHRTFSTVGWINQTAGMTLDLMGASSYFWRNNHVGSHHVYTNIADKDPDIQVSCLVRLSSEQPLYWFHRFQHWYLWGLYALVHLRYIYSDMWRMVQAGKNDASPPLPRGWDLLGFITGKLLFIGIAFIIPMTQHTCYHVIGFYVAVSMCIGVIFSVIFQLAHSVDNVLHPSQHDGQSKSEWMIHQLKTTSNFATGNHLLGFFLGGLHRQREHHLFPDVPHVRLSVIEHEVKKFCKEYDLPCNAHQTIWQALCSHYQFLKQMGSAPAST